jgi:hypothetical protein
MYHQFNIHQFYVLSTMHLCVLRGSQNKQRLFPYTALTYHVSVFITGQRVFTVRYVLNL